VEFAGACYHVINRGNYRREIFAGKGAADSFQACLGEAAGKFGCRLHAFIILWNHFHLAVETPEPNLSDGMKWLQGTWVARFNRYHGVVGRPFQGRYKALHVEPGHTLAQVAHYIHLNPARARRGPVERLLEYRWSSLPLFLAKERDVVSLGRDNSTGKRRARGHGRRLAQLSRLSRPSGRGRAKEN